MGKRFAVILMCLAACSLSCNTRGPHVGKTVIYYTRWGNPSEMESTRELIAQFEVENPDIKVNVDVVVWSQYWTKMKTASVTNTAQDVWLVSAAYIEEYVNAGHLTDLSDYFESDRELNIEDYFRNAFDDFCFEKHDNYWRPAPYGKGRMYALPRDYNCQVLYYNRDHFDDLELPYPNGTWTWDDLAAAAKKLTLDFDNDGIIDQWGYGGLSYMAVAHTSGGRFLDASQPYSLETTHKYRVHPPPGIQVNIGSNFQTGKISMIVSGIWEVRKYNDSDSLWDIAPIPVDRKGRTRHQADGGVAHCIYAGSTKKDAAWKLVKFLSSETSQRTLARSGTSVPVLREVAHSDEFLAPFDRPSRRSLHYVYEVLEAPRTPRRAPKGHLEYTAFATRTLDAVWRNNLSPARACEMIDTETDSILAEHYGDHKP